MIIGSAKGGVTLPNKNNSSVAFGGGNGNGFIEATGGSITIDDINFKVHKFTTSDIFEITSGSGDVEYLVLGAGGGAGRNNGGGGAAGAFRADTKSDMGVDEYDVTIGEKGLGLTVSDSSPEEHGQGGDTVFSDITSNGGGYGGGTPTGTTGGNGGDSVNGSGGGARNNALKGSTTGSPAFGFDGGSGADSSAGSGGGGAAEIGEDAGSAAGDGGDGLASDIIVNGSNIFYCGGGGGAIQHSSNDGGAPGLGGAGKGGNLSTAGQDAFISGTNGGYGSGGGGSTSSHDGGDGFDGLVVLRYQFQE